MVSFSISTYGKLDFLIVGAEKSGTTWLARMLMQHPQVYIPPQKELYYFNRKFVEIPEVDNYHFDKPVEWYLSFFKDAHPGQKKGEACPAYLWDEAAPRRIYEFDPGLHIFMTLRNPVERTLSAYRFYVQRGIISEPLEQALSLYWHQLIERSAYALQVQRYLDLFPREQVHIYLYDDLRRDPVAFLQAVERDLGVEEFLPPDVLKPKNVTGDPKYPWLNVLLFQVRAWARRSLPPAMIDVVRALGIARAAEALRQRNRKATRPTRTKALDPILQRLQEFFAPDILRLQDLIGRDLSAWLE